MITLSPTILWSCKVGKNQFSHLRGTNLQRQNKRCYKNLNLLCTDLKHIKKEMLCSRNCFKVNTHKTRCLYHIYCKTCCCFFKVNQIFSMIIYRSWVFCHQGRIFYEVKFLKHIFFPQKFNLWGLTPRKNCEKYQRDIDNVSYTLRYSGTIIR